MNGGAVSVQYEHGHGGRLMLAIRRNAPPLMPAGEKAREEKKAGGHGRKFDMLEITRK